MTARRVLVVDDETAMLENCARLLARAGYQTRTLTDPAPLRDVLAEFRPDVLLLDLRLRGLDGMAVLSAALAEDPLLPVVMMTAYATVGSAVQAIREGAFDYIAKPFTADQLGVVIRRAVDYRGLAEENRALRQQVARQGGFAEVVGTSPVMERLLEQVRKVGPSEASVLLTGESGTGKEVMARCLHEASPRRGGPFVAIDCAALPEALLEGELFGHERGAFTGAVARKVGLLVTAKGGTVFLDEVTQFTPALQAKLLRVLEERKLRPVGGTQLLEIDVRIIAASNEDIEAAVASGRFRQDLYYRLNVVQLTLPALRDRTGDVVPLLQHFLAHFAAAASRAAPRASPEAQEALEAYRWPGNVRELRNLAHRLVVMDDDGRVTLADLPAEIRGWRDTPDGASADGAAGLPGYAEAREAALVEFQQVYVRRLLEQYRGNITQAARAAGVSRRTVHRWLADLPESPGLVKEEGGGAQ